MTLIVNKKQDGHLFEVQVSVAVNVESSEYVVTEMYRGYARWEVIRELPETPNPWAQPLDWGSPSPNASFRKVNVELFVEFVQDLWLVGSVAHQPGLVLSRHPSLSIPPPLTTEN